MGKTLLEQGSATSLVGVDTLVNPLVAGQLAATDDLFRAEVFGQ